VVVGMRAGLGNLPGQVEYELPESGSWGEDLQVYLAGAMELEEIDLSGELEVPIAIEPNRVEPSKPPQSRQRGMSM
jgi:hypothetical protein